MQNILITGGAGFIGANFINYWLKKFANDNIIVLDALTYSGNLQNISINQNNPKFKFIHGNILDQQLLNKIFEDYQINYVVHFAAESHVDRSIINPENFIRTNVMGTYTLLETAKKYWLDKNEKELLSYHFHHVSTDEVYGSLASSDLPVRENAPYLPNSPYAASKASSNHLVRAYYQTYGLPITISNCSNNYGLFQHSEKFIPTVIRSCLNKKPIPIYGDGSNIRDWLHVDDHCFAIDLILQHGKMGETYNIGANNEMTNLMLTQMICKMMDQIIPMKQSYESLISFVKDRPGHDWRYAVDISKAKSQLGYLPRIDFNLGLNSTIKYYCELFEKRSSALLTQ